jgi:hypothetical protein
VAGSGQGGDLGQRQRGGLGHDLNRTSGGRARPERECCRDVARDGLACAKSKDDGTTPGPPEVSDSWPAIPRRHPGVC